MFPYKITDFIARTTIMEEKVMETLERKHKVPTRQIWELQDKCNALNGAGNLPRP
jgi:hypothetical protein